MPERPSSDPGHDPELLRALARLELGDLPGPLRDAAATALEWARLLDAEAAGSAGAEPRRLR